jgi:hypothetical protein
MAHEDEHVITIRIPRVLHDEIERIATKEHSSVSGQVRAWLSAAVAAESRKGAE